MFHDFLSDYKMHETQSWTTYLFFCLFVCLFFFLNYKEEQLSRLGGYAVSPRSRYNAALPPPPPPHSKSWLQACQVTKVLLSKTMNSFESNI